MKLRISTFNIQNDYGKYNISKTKEIIDYIKKNKIDIVGLQEVYKKLDKDLENNIDYKYFGKYRFISRFILRRINEKTPILLKKDIISYQDYHLPYLPGLMKRIMTKVEIMEDNKKISIYNTHLDYQFDIVKKRQLKRIIKIIKNDTNLIVLMGDFNLKNNNPIFREFIDELKELGIYHIDINDKTLKTSKGKLAIDHIFLSNDFKLLNKERITSISTSDHYPILIDVKI